MASTNCILLKSKKKNNYCFIEFTANGGIIIELRTMSLRIKKTLYTVHISYPDLDLYVINKNNFLSYHRNALKNTTCIEMRFYSLELRLKDNLELDSLDDFQTDLIDKGLYDWSYNDNLEKIGNLFLGQEPKCRFVLTIGFEEKIEEYFNCVLSYSLLSNGIEKDIILKYIHTDKLRYLSYMSDRSNDLRENINYEELWRDILQNRYTFNFYKYVILDYSTIRLEFLALLQKFGIDKLFYTQHFSGLIFQAAEFQIEFQNRTDIIDVVTEKPIYRYKYFEIDTNGYIKRVTVPDIALQAKKDGSSIFRLSNTLLKRIKKEWTEEWFEKEKAKCILLNQKEGFVFIINDDFEIVDYRIQAI